MKSVYKYIVSICINFSLLMGCERQELPFYKGETGVYFDGTTWNFTFGDVPGKSEDTVRIPVLVCGDSCPYDRTLAAEVVVNANTTAPTALYELLPGKVERGKFKGILPVVLKNPASGILDDTVFKVNIRLIPSDDFPEVRLGREAYLLSFTNQVIQPTNWHWLSYYFGTYSSGWWTKIREWTGRMSLPYYPNHADTVTWNMSVGEIQAYKAMVKVKLEAYNAGPNGPLLHNDGEKSGQKVVMP